MNDNRWFVMMGWAAVVVCFVGFYVSGCETARYRASQSGRTTFTIQYEGPALPDTLILR